MAIGATDLVWTFPGGRAVPDGALHAVFGPGTVGGPTDYRLLELRNTHATLTLTAVRAWLSDPAGGAALAIALGSPAAAALDSAWGDVEAANLSYSAPTSKASGVALPDLPPGMKALIGVRRSLAGATPLYPEVCRLLAGGTSPI